MKQLTVYGYDTNKKYTSTMTLDESYLTPVSKEWCIPANYTTVNPPNGKDGYDRVWNGEEWEYKEIPVEPEPPEPEPPTLDEIKTQKILELKSTRDAKEVANIRTLKGIFDYDDKSRDRLSIARQALTDAGGTGTIVWTTADNQRVPLTVADFAEINTVAAQRSNALHVKYNELKSLVEQAETIAEVEAIEWADSLTEG